MIKIDTTEILESILETVHSHKLGDGQYARYHACRGAKINAYGCADAANILYSLRSLPRDRAERDAFVAAIRSFQDPASGYFLEGSHHKIHTTAHCTAALELFDALPLYPFTDMEQYLDAAHSFHYYFNYGDAHRAIPYPAALIDACLDAYRGGAFEETFGRQFHFIEMDWVYCLNRATYQTAHRFDEVKSALLEFAKGYISYLAEVDYKTDPGANDLHLLFGVVCALIELQKALPGMIVSEIPTRLVLDRRPFI